VVHALEQRGISKSEAARLFAISLSSVKRYARLVDRGEPLTPRKGGGRPPIADDARRKLLEEDVRARPSATVEERRRFLESFAGKSLSEPTLRRLLKRMGFSRKKDCGGAGTRRVREGDLEGDGSPITRCSLFLVFVDEMGTNTLLSPLYGWAKKGERAYCSVPRNRGKNTTVLASMSVQGMGPSLAVEGATTAAVFETYVERVLAPTLRKRQVGS
jgi:transposase